MLTSSYTEKAIKQLVRDAVKAALKDQKDAHDEVIQKLINDQKAGHSPLSGTNLTRSSGISYNSMGGIYTTPLATMPRPSLTTSTTSPSISSGGGVQAPSSQEYFQALTMTQSQVEKDLVQRPDDPVTEKGLYARLQAFDDYNNLGGRKGLREVMGVKWLRILEFTQGVSVPDESRGDSELRIFLETLFISTNTQNFRLERAFQTIRMPKKAITIETMQLYAAEFAAELADQLPKIADPNDRLVQEAIISYFYKGLHPEYLREKISHFKVSTKKEVFNIFREYCTPIMVEAANFSFLDTRRRKETPLIKPFPRESNRHSSESPRAAKKAGSLQSEIARNFPLALSGDLPFAVVYPYDNRTGTGTTPKQAMNRWLIEHERTLWIDLFV